MGDYSLSDEPTEVLVSIEEALPGMRIVDLPEGQSWLGALMFIKTHGAEGGGWSMRRTEGLSRCLRSSIDNSLSMRRCGCQGR